MKSKLIVSILVFTLALSGILGATAAYFSDSGTSNGNTFTAGSLDLKVDGVDENVTLFNLSGISPTYFVKPGSQPNGEYKISNSGTLAGYLNIKDIVVTNLENTRIDPEIKAGDLTDDVGELGDFLFISIFDDKNGDGWISTGETRFYDGKINELPDSLLMNLKIAPGDVVNVVGVITNWWQGSNDNLAQTDSVTVDLTFTLDQVAQKADS